MDRGQQIAPGLWRWTAPHPDWRPDALPDSADDWERDVGCVLYDAPDAVVLIDPLVPPDPGFLDALDRHVERRDRPVVVLTTIRWHRRSGPELTARYGASTSRARRALPAGVEARPLRGVGEVVFWLPAPRALVSGDRILGSSSGLRICPPSWLGGDRRRVALLRERLAPLLDLPIERVLVSHGRPVLTGGRAALAAALEAEAAAVRS